MSGRVILGDCRAVMPAAGPFDMIIADPPYGDTSLDWDRRVSGWLEVARACLQPTGSLWVFGSFRFFLETGAAAFASAGLRYVQDVVWEKHNGSGLFADRFRRVHETVAQFIRDDAKWSNVYNRVQTTPDARARVVRRKQKPAHFGALGASRYTSEDGGPRLMRSVIFARSCHGRAIHPTEKPVDLLEILIRTSCPGGGRLGDFFAGSGAAGEAALMAGRAYVGAEIDPGYWAAASARLAALLPLCAIEAAE